AFMSANWQTAESPGKHSLIELSGGSSISRSASLRSFAPGIEMFREVMVVLKLIVMVHSGGVCPAGVGIPPVHLTTTSSVNSVSPSAATSGTTVPDWPVHTNGGIV